MKKKIYTFKTWNWVVGALPLYFGGIIVTKYEWYIGFPILLVCVLVSQSALLRGIEEVKK